MEETSKQQMVASQNLRLVCGTIPSEKIFLIEFPHQKIRFLSWSDRYIFKMLQEKSQNIYVLRNAGQIANNLWLSVSSCSLKITAASSKLQKCA